MCLYVANAFSTLSRACSSSVLRIMLSAGEKLAHTQTDYAHRHTHTHNRILILTHTHTYLHLCSFPSRYERKHNIQQTKSQQQQRNRQRGTQRERESSVCDCVCVFECCSLRVTVTRYSLAQSLIANSRVQTDKRLLRVALVVEVDAKK